MLLIITEYVLLCNSYPGKTSVSFELHIFVFIYNLYFIFFLNMEAKLHIGGFPYIFHRFVV